MEKKLEKMQKTIEKGPGNQKNVRKWHFLEKPPMKDFKNGGFYIPKIYKTDP